MSYAAINQSTYVSLSQAETWKQPLASGVTLESEGSVQEFTPEGFKLPTQQNQNTEHTKITGKGVPDFNDILLWLSGVFHYQNTNTIVTPNSPPNLYQHNFIFNNSTPNVTDLYDIVVGSTDYAEKATDIKLTSFNLKLNRTGSQELSFSGYGKKIITSEDLDVVGNVYPIIFEQVQESPATAITWLVKYGSAHNTINSIFTSPFNVEIGLDSLANMVYGFNRTLTYNEMVDIKPKSSVKLKMPINSHSLALRDNLSLGTRKWISIEAQGRALYIDNAVPANNKYELIKFDIPVKVSSVPKRATDQGVLSFDYEFTWDGSSSEPMKVTVLNTIENIWA